MLVTYQISIATLLVLIIATVLCRAVEQHSSKVMQEVKTRVLGWWYVFPLFSLCLAFGRLFLFFLCFVGFMGLKEYFSVVSHRQSDRGVVLVLYLMIPTELILLSQHYAMAAYLIPLIALLIVSLTTTIFGQLNELIVRISQLYWGFVVVSLSIISLGYLSMVKQSILYPTGGAGLILYLVICVQGNDIAQYCWGKLIGGKKIVPHVSPNKTISGFIGGLITTLMISLLFSQSLLLLKPTVAILIGCLLAVTGFLGDILMSGVKRSIGIKDFSALIPGHGGVLDRLDSLIISAPFLVGALSVFQRV
jgi:phosphatidate cytidylyltransferase